MRKLIRLGVAVALATSGLIDRGAPLANGTPSEIQRNPDVIAAYLGKGSEEGDSKPRRSRKAKARSKAGATA